MQNQYYQQVIQQHNSSMQQNLYSQEPLNIGSKSQKKQMKVEATQKIKLDIVFDKSSLHIVTHSGLGA